MNIRSFLYLFSSFSIAKVVLLIGRATILLLGYQWFSKDDFVLITGMLSFIEIIRTVTDVGAENIIYARLLSKSKKVPNIVKALIKLRLVVSFLCFLFLMITVYYSIYKAAWPLVLLLLFGPVLASNIAFIQKSRDFKKISILVAIVFLFAVVSITIAFNYRLNPTSLTILMLLPEFVAVLVSFCLVSTYWNDVLNNRIKYIRTFYRLKPYILPSIAVSVIVSLYTRLDVVVVRPVLGISAQAEYSVAFRLVEPLFLVLSLGSLAFLTELGSINSRLSRQHSLKVYSLFNISNLLKLMAFGIFLSFLLQWVSFKLLNLTLLSSWVVFCLVLAIPIKLCNTILTSILQRAGQYQVVMIAALIALVSTIFLSYFLGSNYGVIGVASAVLLSELTNFKYQKARVKAALKGV